MGASAGQILPGFVLRGALVFANSTSLPGLQAVAQHSISLALSDEQVRDFDF
jgi:hypothetical protein